MIPIGLLVPALPEIQEMRLKFVFQRRKECLQRKELKENNGQMMIGFFTIRKYLLSILPLCLCWNALAQEFRIPDISELPRVDRNSPRPSTYHLRNSAFVLKFKNHAPGGKAYVILTDHEEAS